MTLALGAVTGAMLLVGCSDASDDSSDDLAGTSSADRGIDASQYVDGYEQQSEQDSAVSGSTSSLAAPSEIGPPGLLDGNTFVEAGTSGFVDAGEDPESTFALDVDTGSYTVARGLLEQGIRPPAASIRVEEWVNAFAYDDPAPTEADLAVTAETGRSSTSDDGTQLVRVAVTSRELAEDDRPRLHVTLVVDRSGSMDIRQRLGLVKSSLGVLADRLGDDDTVSVVSFDDEARPILEPTEVRDTEAILGAIDRLQPGGSTNLEAGLRLGYEQARESFDEDGVNVVVLCSDGVANVGETGPDSIVDQIAEEGADGIHLVTVGYGMGNYNDHLMEQLADLGDGFYSYVDTFDEAERLFGTELTTTLVPVAGEARTQVGFDPEVVASYRLVGYDNRAMADDDFEDLSVDAGELGPGHHATALYEVRLREGVDPGAAIGTADVRWVSLPDGSAQRATTVLRAYAAAGTGDSPGSDLELASTVADTAELLKGVEGVEGVEGAEGYLVLTDVERRAEALVESDVTGAEELLQLIREAEQAQ